jgi:hypothetical protein
MPANVSCLQPEQLAKVGSWPERVAQGLFVDPERGRGHELAVDLDEQKRTLGRPTVERGQTFECGLVAYSAMADQDRTGGLQVVRAYLVP